MHQWTSPQETVVRTPDGRTIPADPQNAEFAALLASGDEIAKCPKRSLPDVQAEALAAIQTAADARHRTLSSSPEQDIRYLNKAEDVQLAQLGDAAAIARLTLEADARGVTVQQLAAVVTARRGAFKALIADMEAARSAGLAAVKAASTETVADALADAIAAIEKVGA